LAGCTHADDSEKEKPAASTAPSAVAAPDLSLEGLQALGRVLDRLPLGQYLDYPRYEDAVRAHLKKSGEPKWRRLAELLENDAGHGHGVLAVRALIASRWARTFKRQERIEALAAMIRHPTVNAADAKTPGRSPAFDAFEADLKKRAEDLGLVFEHTEHVAYSVMPPRGSEVPLKERVAVLVHGDVVPAGEPGWKVDPFAGIVEADRVVGRGALDDKGPMVAVLYALAALHHAGLQLATPPTLIVGTSEETHWSGIDRFLAVHGNPGAIFVADGAFPVGNGEKGITNVRLQSAPTPEGTPAKGTVFLQSITGGQVSNQVPATAEAVVGAVDAATFKALNEKMKRAAGEARGLFKVQIDLNPRGDQTVLVQVRGQSAHGASPQKGVNAISPLLFMLGVDLPWHKTPCLDLIHLLNDTLGQDLSGAGLGVAMTHPEFSPTTVNLGLFRQDDAGACKATLNIRWPPPDAPKVVVAKVEARIRQVAEEKGRTAPEVSGGGLAPFFVSPESPLVKSLQYAYAATTGRDATPRTISGTTYSKAVPGAVTFGPGSEATRSRIHAPNEYLELSAFDEMVQTYTFALLLLSASGAK
jgi:succinyl-diaminopimelate desuccinylase